MLPLFKVLASVDHFNDLFIIEIIELLCSALENNVVSIILQKQTQKKKSNLWLPGAGGGGVNWMKVVKNYELPFLR